MKCLEEQKTIRDYLSLLEDAKMEHMKHPALWVFRGMDRLRNNLSMASSELKSAKRGIKALAYETEGKSHAQRALSSALEGIASAIEYSDQIESIIIKGVADAMAWFRAGRSSALEKPFPIQNVEQKLDIVKKCLYDAFAATDIGIGLTEETEGLFCYAGHYWVDPSIHPTADDIICGENVSATLWVEGGGDPALPDVLWPMRSLETVIKQAYDVAHETAVRADCLRPKSRTKIYYSPINEGYFWEKEKAERLEKQGKQDRMDNNSIEEKNGDSSENIEIFAAKGEQDNKISLRKKLQVAEKNVQRRYSSMPASEKRMMVGDIQR